MVDGSDQSGISKAVGWPGGGGFKVYTLAPSLLRKDSFGNWVIDERYDANKLAAAVCQHEGYRFSPSETQFWKQGQSTEKDFLFVTTQLVTRELLDNITADMQLDESLLIVCKAHQDGLQRAYEAINVRKLPAMLLGRCEFGRDDYSLNIVNLPPDETDEADPDTAPVAEEPLTERPAKAPAKKKAKPIDNQPTLF